MISLAKIHLHLPAPDCDIKVILLKTPGRPPGGRLQYGSLAPPPPCKEMGHGSKCVFVMRMIPNDDVGSATHVLNVF